MTPLTVCLSSEKAQNPARKHFEKTNSMMTVLYYHQVVNFKCVGKEIVQYSDYRLNYCWNILPEDIINAPTLDTFQARLDKCWSGRKFICTKLKTKQLKSQNKDYLEGNENIRPTERP